jgi:hypothetical protein
MEDFYSLLARHWGLDRCDAKSRLITWYFTKVTWDMSCGINFDSPKVLDYIPPEARAEAMAHWGVELGYN